MLPRERLRRSGVMGDLYIHTRLGRYADFRSHLSTNVCAVRGLRPAWLRTRPAHETGPATAAPRPGRRYVGMYVGRVRSAV